MKDNDPLLFYEELPLTDIVDLEFPNYPDTDPTRRAFLEALVAAVKCRRIYNVTLVQVINGRILRNAIFRESYRDWRAQCPTELLSPLSQISKWVGPTPAVKTLPPALPTQPALPTDRPEQGAAAKWAALAQLFDELDKRAAEQGAEFDRHSLPGTKKEFALLLKSHCSMFRYIGTARIAYYLKGKCQFQRGAKPEHGKGAAVWALFPEYDLK